MSNYDYDYTRIGLQVLNDKLLADWQEKNIAKIEEEAILFEEQRRADQEAKNRWAAHIAEQVAKKQAALDQAESDRIEAILEPRLRYEKNSWLAKNPTMTASDFESLVLPYLKENFINDIYEAERKAKYDAYRAMYKFSL